MPVLVQEHQLSLKEENAAFSETVFNAVSALKISPDFIFYPLNLKSLFKIPLFLPENGSDARTTAGRMPYLTWTPGRQTSLTLSSEHPLHFINHGDGERS